MDSGRDALTLQGHTAGVYGVALSGDGRLAVSASSDQTLKVWELESGRALRTLAGHSGEVYGVALTPDGKRAVSASGDNTLKVWGLASGLELASFKVDVSLLCCAICPDGKTILVTIKASSTACALSSRKRFQRLLMRFAIPSAAESRDLRFIPPRQPPFLQPRGSGILG